MAMPDWPHAPVHRLTERGAYLITCGTHRKAHHLRTRERLTLVMEHLFSCFAEFGWCLQAWAILSNHYHAVALSPEDPSTLSRAISKLHTLTACALNAWDAEPKRKVWFQYFESHITYPSSTYARLRYVHENPVHHGLVRLAEHYPWCSAGWFARTAKPSFRRMVTGFKIDCLHVADEFAPLRLEESGVKPPHSKGQAMTTTQPCR